MSQDPKETEFRRPKARGPRDNEQRRDKRSLVTEGIRLLAWEDWQVFAPCVLSVADSVALVPNPVAVAPHMKRNKPKMDALLSACRYGCVSCRYVTQSVQELIQHYKTRTHSGEQDRQAAPLFVFLVQLTQKVPQEFSLTQISKTDRMWRSFENGVRRCWHPSLSAKQHAYQPAKGSLSWIVTP